MSRRICSDNSSFRTRRRKSRLGSLNRPFRVEFNQCGLEQRVLLSSAPSSQITLPLAFEPNEGQVAGSVQFVARGPGYQLALSGSDASLSLQQSGASTFDRVAMSLVGGQVPTATQGVDPLPGKVNYFLGPDPTSWRTDIPTYSKVQLDNVYPGVNLVYYGNQGQLEYDFVVAPGADPRSIAVHYDGIAGASLDADGNLVLSTSGGNVVMHRPVLYQEIGGAHRDVQGSFDLRGPNEVSFQVGTYDHAQPLIIDPILVYSTYFGGSGDDQAFAVAVDDQGAAYFTGSTLSLDLATTAGANAQSSFISEIFKSTNSAASWNGAGVGLPDASFSALVVDPTNPNIVYGGTDNNNSFSAQGLFKSTNGGASWTAIDNGLAHRPGRRLARDRPSSSIDLVRHARRIPVQDHRRRIDLDEFRDRNRQQRQRRRFGRTRDLAFESANLVRDGQPQLPLQNDERRCELEQDQRHQPWHPLRKRPAPVHAAADRRPDGSKHNLRRRDQRRLLQHTRRRLQEHQWRRHVRTHRNHHHEPVFGTRPGDGSAGPEHALRARTPVLVVCPVSNDKRRHDLDAALLEHRRNRPGDGRHTGRLDALHGGDRQRHRPEHRPGPDVHERQPRREPGHADRGFRILTGHDLRRDPGPAQGRAGQHRHRRVRGQAEPSRNRL